MFLNVDNVGAKRMSSGRLFQATGTATRTVRLCIGLFWLLANEQITQK